MADIKCRNTSCRNVMKFKYLNPNDFAEGFECEECAVEDRNKKAAKEILLDNSNGAISTATIPITNSTAIVENSDIAAPSFFEKLGFKKKKGGRPKKAKEST